MTAPADANRDLKRAAAAYGRGDLSKAEKHCAAVLRAYPLDFNALHLMGVICGRLGRQAEALTYLDRAMDIRRGHPDVLRNRGSALVELGRLAEGLNDYDLALAIRPDHAPTLNDRGCALLLLENFEEALATFARAVTIDPSSADFTNNLGRALVRLDRYDDALACFEDALSMRPDFIGALINAGGALSNLERYEEALLFLGRALEKDPNNHEALFARALCLREIARFGDALESYDGALRGKADWVEALIGSSVCLRRLKRLADSDARLKRALAICDDVEAYADKLSRPPHLRGKSLAQAHCQRGLILLNLRRYVEALDDLQRALSLAPEQPEAAWNLGWIHLILGNFAQGWSLYEARRRQKNTKWVDLDGPEWSPGDAYEGKRIFVYAEQAMGDTLQFARFAGMLAERGVKVSLGIHRPLAALFRSLTFQPEIVLHGEHTGAYDFHVPLMSLPHLLGVKEDELARNVPYLRAEEARAAYWRERLPKDGLKIGLVWQGSADDHRSIPLTAFAPLGRIPGVTYVSLQRIEESAQLAHAPDGLNIVSFRAARPLRHRSFPTAAIVSAAQPSAPASVTTGSSTGLFSASRPTFPGSALAATAGAASRSLCPTAAAAA